MHKRFLGVVATLTAVGILAACGGKKDAGATATVAADGYKEVTQIGMTVKWKAEATSLDIIVHAPAKGWIAVGFDPETLMKGSDIVVGYVDSGAQTTIVDHYADQLTGHKADADLGGTNDVTVISGEETEAGTTLHFSIPLNSGDKFDKVLAAGTTHKMMLAYGTTDDFTSPHAANHRAVFKVDI